MKISKEAKVGLLGIISLAVLYIGFNFLKGLDLFSTENEYKVVFNDVNGLQVSNAVTYKGVTVGRVMSMETDQENDQIDVTLAVKKKIKITDQSIALLADDGLIGGKLIKLDIKPGNELKQGEEIIGEIELGLADAAIQEITPALSHVDSLVVNLNEVVKQFDQTGTALKALMASANQTTNGVNAVLAKNQASLAKITTNAAMLTDNLNTLTVSLDSQMAPIMTQTGEFTQNLSTLELEKTVNNLNSTIAGLQQVLADVNSGQGTLGKLTSDEALYGNLENTAASLDALLSDMKTNPRRYVHFSLFGGKDKTEKKK
ncbi:MlaD family protein [Jiulongibacter sediminis]|uniref:Mammalian cell entry protein n=1 Tax=Jiulongibacter sediminis TaxID=1605367 RepID=A0A0P7C2D3_9BACT|nr:MlaD family protein [Jiulongibacter sediminis]KPM48185.1 mammalian cell entry protein [Jiulongibacter sediminis]TBX24486.1 mammalian cell entry protein [Jiulongibacter sediminis]